MLPVIMTLLLLPCCGNNPLNGWDINETNTGLAGAGVDGASLPLYAGPVRPASGTVIRLMRIDRQLDFSEGDITIEKCLVQPVSVGAGTPLTGGNLYIIDSEIDGSLILNDDDIAFSMGYSGNGAVIRCYIHDTGSGIALGQSDSEVIADGNYVHRLRAGFNSGGASHTDGFTLRYYTGPCAKILNNRFDCSSGHDTGALFLQPTYGLIKNIHIEGNLLEGGGYTLMLEARGYGYGSLLEVVNNRFNPSGFGVGYVDGGSGWDIWENNYMYDPSADECRGEIVAAPEPFN